MYKSLKLLVIALLAWILCACQADLLTALSEVDCNEALAVLLSADVAAQKVSLDNGKTWNLKVEEAQFVTALRLLSERGLPRDHFSNLGEMFKKDGLISTPIEERVRFIHGVSQELSETLSKLDGVLVARVHIVLPNRDPLAAEGKPASASVFIKYRPEMAIASLMAPVRNLVSYSVEGLDYKNVSVTFVPSDVSESKKVPVAKSVSIYSWLWVLPLACICAAACLAWLVFRKRGQDFFAWFTTVILFFRQLFKLKGRDSIKQGLEIER